MSALNPSKVSTVYPLDLAESYQPVRRSFTNPKNGKRTSLTLERVYWDHIQRWADDSGNTWSDIVQALSAGMPANARDRASFIRATLLNFFSRYNVSHE